MNKLFLQIHQIIYKVIQIYDFHEDSRTTHVITVCARGHHVQRTKTFQFIGLDHRDM